MEKIAVFRVDASARIGSGHVSRCLALADYLAARGWDCIFAVSSETCQAFPRLDRSTHRVCVVANAFDAVSVGLATGKHATLTVIDHYSIDAHFETACRKWSERIMVIDDLANRYHDCDFLIDQTLGRVSRDYSALVPSDCRQLLGPEYALLRPEFSRLREQTLERPRESLRRILVAIGGADPHDITGLALQAILASGLTLEVDVALGSISPNCLKVSEFVAAAGKGWQLHLDTTEMAKLISSADLAIGACGVGSWERCTLGLPSIAVVIADNQRMIARELRRRAAIIYAGDWGETSVKVLERHLLEMAGDGALRAAIAANAAAVCDGRGLERVGRVLAT